MDSLPKELCVHSKQDTLPGSAWFPIPTGEELNRFFCIYLLTELHTYHNI